MARLELALPMAGVLLVACAPAPAPLTDAQLDDYMASQRKATATLIPTALPSSTPDPLN